ncbi:D-alanine--D-alanine ligase [Taibaiella sp. KBW10]|uniref:D-alanine--D-alanine ligase n=1 Tax=Taibaiella sp. KBW10 TaxID=2153357 RepID=UPI000F596977|nr:D-alanine--D-alanine ligase [Taibaiella sp. KBW10]RQO31443.1 D-alanine--D-alanine ligase [Taibaiella sp. KBW10]
MKKNIALVAGGYSEEHIISIGSAKTIEKNLDADKYSVYKIIITKESWYYEYQDSRIEVDKNDFSIIVAGNKINFEAVFIAIHGTPGEDGKLQGYFDMIGMPYTTCNAIVSAVTFNKSFCNKVVNDFGVVNIAKSVHLFKEDPYSLGSVLDKIQLPVFVKPNEGGSSIATTKVSKVEDLHGAIEAVFAVDTQALIEEFIEGRELTMGVYRIGGEINTLPPTEIISKNEFFDYAAKYNNESEEVTPAQIPDNILRDLQDKAKVIFLRLNCKGFVRMDFILNKHNNELYFLEVNTMPGQSEQSLIPQQVRAAGMQLNAFYEQMLEECLRNKK